MAFLRRIPEKVITKIKSFSSPAVRVACTVELSETDIAERGLGRLGISVSRGSLVVPSGIVFPDPSFGIVSNANANGKESVDKKSPMVDKEIYLGDRPVYGDWKNGSFSLWQTRKVYRRTIVQPKGFALRITLAGNRSGMGKWKAAFGIEPVFQTNRPDFEDDLLFALSLLREITGRYDVYSAEETLAQIAESRIVSWEIFPPGQRNLKDEISRRLKNIDENRKETILERAGTIEALHPKQYIFGAGLASNYYGALFKDDLVVFENLDYGNATYILYENWVTLSKLSRTELLNGKENFDRVIHGPSWASSVKEIVEHHSGRVQFRIW